MKKEKLLSEYGNLHLDLLYTRQQNGPPTMSAAISHVLSVSSAIGHEASPPLETSVILAQRAPKQRNTVNSPLHHPHRLSITCRVHALGVLDIGLQVVRD